MPAPNAASGAWRGWPPDAGPATRRENRHPRWKDRWAQHWSPARLATGPTPPGLPAVMAGLPKDRADACRPMPLT